MNVLHIQSSPRGDKSNSIALTNAFLSASRKVLPVINEDVLNVWDENLPEFDAASIGAKYKAIKHQPLTDAESETWNRIQELIGRFQRANRIVLGAHGNRIPRRWRDPAVATGRAVGCRTNVAGHHGGAAGAARGVAESHSGAPRQDAPEGRCRRRPQGAGRLYPRICISGGFSHTTIVRSPGALH